MDLSYNRKWKVDDWYSNFEDQYSYVGGCSVKHPFNESKRKDCEENYFRKQGLKETDAQADLVLAQAALQASAKNTSWTAGQTALVIGASLAGLALLSVIIIKAKKK